MLQYISVLSVNYCFERVPCSTGLEPPLARPRPLMTISGWTLVLLLVSAQRANQNPGPVSVRQSESSWGSYTRLSISTEITHQHRDTSLIPWQYTNNQDYNFYISIVDCHWVVRQFVLILWWAEIIMLILLQHKRNPKRESCFSFSCFTTF